MIKGFKCFNQGLITNYNEKLNVNKIYFAKDEIKYSKNGYHMCVNLEDTLRFFNSFSNPVDIAKVIGFGKTDRYDDEYNDFYEMYAVEFLEIIKVLSREEIIEYAKKLPDYRLIRFISLYKLTDEEIILFKKLFCNNNDILNTILYYQENKTDVYEKEYQLVKKRF